MTPGPGRWLLWLLRMRCTRAHISGTGIRTYLHCKWGQVKKVFLMQFLRYLVKFLLCLKQQLRLLGQKSLSSATE